MDNIILSDRYEVLTNNGFKQFYGIRKAKAITIKIDFGDNDYLECTTNHLIKNNNVFVSAGDFNVGDFIDNKQIINIEYHNIESDVFDLLNVVDGNEYITNSVTSHNCAFIEGWDEFYASTYPTITSGKTTKMLFTSTPLWIKSLSRLLERGY